MSDDWHRTKPPQQHLQDPKRQHRRNGHPPERVVAPRDAQGSARRRPGRGIWGGGSSTGKQMPQTSPEDNIGKNGNAADNAAAEPHGGARGGATRARNRERIEPGHESEFKGGDLK